MLLLCFIDVVVLVVVAATTATTRSLPLALPTTTHHSLPSPTTQERSACAYVVSAGISSAPSLTLHPIFIVSTFLLTLEWLLVQEQASSSHIYY